MLQKEFRVRGYGGSKCSQVAAFVLVRLVRLKLHRAASSTLRTDSGGVEYLCSKRRHLVPRRRRSYVTSIKQGYWSFGFQAPGVRLIDVGSFPQNFGAQTSDTPDVKTGGTPIRFTSLAGQPFSCPLVARIRSLDCRISSILALTSFSSEKSYAIH
jgi:hypothetical protein